MYLPRHFEQDDTRELHRLMRSHPLGILVTRGADGLTANHLPFLVFDEPAPHGRLQAHVPRANPVWRDHQEDEDALVVFQGPQAYVSPSWYPGKREHGKVVPTWNYSVVHAHGPLRVIDEAAWLLQHLERLTETQEGLREEPWKLADAPADFVAGLVKALVGIEIPLRRLEGKWKVSQNRSEADRQGVVDGLLGENTDAAAAVADLMVRQSID